MRQLAFLALGAGLLLQLTACQLVGPTVQCECARCAPPILLHVTQAGGGAVPNVAIVGATGSCSSDSEAKRTTCFVGDGPGQYEFEVRAAGFQTLRISQEVKPETGDGCCECGYASVTLERELSP